MKDRASNDSVYLVTEARTPVQMTAIPDIAFERGRSPVPITPVQTHSTQATAPAPAVVAPLKKD
jgi:hypothetical protein